MERFHKGWPLRAFHSRWGVIQLQKLLLHISSTHENRCFVCQTDREETNEQNDSGKTCQYFYFLNNFSSYERSISAREPWCDLFFGGTATTSFSHFQHQHESPSTLFLLTSLMKCWKRREIVCLICRVLAALVDDQRAPHCGEQLEESLQEEADRKKTWRTGMKRTRNSWRNLHRESRVLLIKF